MKRLSVFVSLITEQNDYQREQAAAVVKVARGLGMNIRLAYADNNAVHQTQQLLEVIQNRAERPDAIVVEPVGTECLKWPAPQSLQESLGTDQLRSRLHFGTPQVR